LEFLTGNEREQLVHRLICSQSQVESNKIKTGSLSNHEFQRIVEAVGEMQKHVMVIDDQAGLKITDLRARARRMKESYNIGFLVIDYLQLISGSGSNRNAENRQAEISEISVCSKTSRVSSISDPLPIPALPKSGRAARSPSSHERLRESGSIEQDSDIVMFLLRREYYDAHDKPGMAELIVAKNRHGGIGSINLTYRKEIVRFENYTQIPIHRMMTWKRKGLQPVYAGLSRLKPQSLLCINRHLDGVKKLHAFVHGLLEGFSATDQPHSPRTFIDDGGFYGIG